MAACPRGDRTRDVYLNGAAYWKNVSSKVWSYTLGGYQVIKKWLSYREHPRDLARLVARQPSPDAPPTPACEDQISFATRGLPKCALAILSLDCWACSRMAQDRYRCRLNLGLEHSDLPSLDESAWGVNSAGYLHGDGG